MELYSFTYTYASIYLTVRWVDMKYSDAQKEATARYNKKAYDRIDVVAARRASDNTMQGLQALDSIRLDVQ